MGNAARAMIRNLRQHYSPVQEQTTDDPVAIDLMRQLERLGMGRYLPEPDPEDERREALRDWTEWSRYYDSGRYDADREARRKVEAEDDRQQNLSTADRFKEALQQSASGSTVIPLNGARVLAAALQGLGGQGTINGG